MLHSQLPSPVRGRSSVEVFITSVQAFLLREMKNQYGRFRMGYFWSFTPGCVAQAHRSMATTR
jgi:hypothetical protein